MFDNDRQIVAFSFGQRKNCHGDFELEHIIISSNLSGKIIIKNEIQVLNELIISLKKRLQKIREDEAYIGLPLD